MNPRVAYLLAMVLGVALMAPAGWAQVTFDDSDADTIAVGNSYYEVKLLKADGNIVGIVDRSTGSIVSSGAQALWHAQFSNGDAIEHRGQFIVVRIVFFITSKNITDI